MWRVLSVALAIQKRGYRAIWIASNSPALNLALIWISARVIACRVAASAVRPKPRREHGAASHIKCHPAPRSAASSVVDAMFSADIHEWPNGSCFRPSPSGSLHSARRKIVPGFTAVIFSVWMRRLVLRLHHQPGPARKILSRWGERELPLR